jgi:4-hydroxybenzoate polyprenyltransferase
MRKRLAAYLELVQFQHTVFALPFALAGAALGARGRPGTVAFLLAIAAVAGLRTAAMAVNRLADRQFDAENPRTALRALVTGEIAPLKAVWLAAAGLALFLSAAAALGRTTLTLAPLFALVAFAYSWTKRFTWTAHFVLGAALAMAPLGGWAATAGTLRGYPWPLSLGVALWVAGFDIVYSGQDEAIDRKLGLHSLPQRFGIRRALLVARASHVAAFAAFAAVAPRAGLGWPYFVGLALVAATLVLEHRAVSEVDLSRIRFAFFTANGIVSVSMFGAIAAALRWAG